MEPTFLRSKKSLVMAWFHQFEALFSCKKIVCFSFDWRHQSHDLNAVSHDLNAIFERVTSLKCNVDVATFMKTAVSAKQVIPRIVLHLPYILRSSVHPRYAQTLLLSHSLILHTFLMPYFEVAFRGLKSSVCILSSLNEWRSLKALSLRQDCKWHSVAAYQRISCDEKKSVVKSFSSSWFVIHIAPKNSTTYSEIFPWFENIFLNQENVTKLFSEEENSSH